MPWRLREGTTFRAWEEEAPGERYPRAIGEWQTPKGTLRQVIAKAEDWPYAAGQMELFSDFGPPRAIKHPVETEQDLDALEYLFDVPGEAMLRGVREHAGEVRKAAAERGIVLQGQCTTGGDSLAWLCGFDHMVYHTIDNPELVRRTLSIIHRNEMRRLEMMLDLGGIDIVVRRAWYESLRSVTLSMHREFLAPLVRDELELAHQAGALYMYICTADTMGLVPTWLESGIDIVWGIDPVQGDADLARLKALAGDRLSFWGGINSWVTLERGGDAEIRQAVEDAVLTMGPGGGFVLLPVDALGENVTPHALEVMIDAWRACATYPLSR
jgi:hypothetical protein